MGIDLASLFGIRMNRYKKHKKSILQTFRHEIKLILVYLDLLRPQVIVKLVDTEKLGVIID
jgi:hypothetical protein